MLCRSIKRLRLEISSKLAYKCMYFGYDGLQYSPDSFGLCLRDTEERAAQFYVIEGMKDAEFLGKANTVDKYPLVIAGQFNLPMLLNMKGKGKHVSGELYQVGTNALERLDEFEGHPTLYEREEIYVAVEGDAEGSTRRCWAYFIKDFSQCDIDLPHLETYDTDGDHGLAYDTSENDELDSR